jgi:hypothetical protein
VRLSNNRRVSNTRILFIDFMVLYMCVQYRLLEPGRNEKTTTLQVQVSKVKAF